MLVCGHRLLSLSYARQSGFNYRVKRFCNCFLHLNIPIYNNQSFHNIFYFICYQPHILIHAYYAEIIAKTSANLNGRGLRYILLLFDR